MIVKGASPIRESSIQIRLGSSPKGLISETKFWKGCWCLDRALCGSPLEGEHLDAMWIDQMTESGFLYQIEN